VPPQTGAGAAAAADHPPLRVPAAFLEKARLVACHRSEQRWALLYALLWRMTNGERHLLELHGDPQVLQLDAWARAVRRDIHKMKAFVRFRAIADGDAPAAGEEAARRFVAWFEPEHLVVEEASGFFRRRMGASCSWASSPGTRRIWPAGRSSALPASCWTGHWRRPGWIGDCST
jgi:DNA polymerase